VLLFGGAFARPRSKNVQLSRRCCQKFADSGYFRGRGLPFKAASFSFLSQQTRIQNCLLFWRQPVSNSDMRHHHQGTRYNAGFEGESRERHHMPCFVYMQCVQTILHTSGTSLHVLCMHSHRCWLTTQITRRRPLLLMCDPYTSESFKFNNRRSLSSSSGVRQAASVSLASNFPEWPAKAEAAALPKVARLRMLRVFGVGRSPYHNQHPRHPRALCLTVMLCEKHE
jgi:hypothetical protein